MKSAFEDIKQGLQEAIAHAKGEGAGVQVHYPRPVDVKALRARVGMTQEQFAATYHISAGTVKGWEQRRRKIDATAAALLRTIEKYPEQVREAQSIYRA